MRTVAVDPVRLERWVGGFAERHGPITTTVGEQVAVVVAEDGAEARMAIPFPPLSGGTFAELLAHVRHERTIAALLVRRGGVAVGIFEGRRLVTSKIETAYVQGKTKAGGWSQQRYARRRDNQARKLTETAADLVALQVMPRLGELAAVATGGDRPSIEAVLADPRLGRLRPLIMARSYPVPDPRLPVLTAFPSQFLAVEIELNDLA